MKCDGCVSAVEGALTDAGANKVQVDLDTKTAVFEAQDTLQAYLAVVANAGFPAQAMS